MCVFKVIEIDRNRSKSNPIRYRMTTYMASSSSSLNGSVSSILLTTSNTSLASTSLSLVLNRMPRLGIARRMATIDWMVFE